MPFGDYMGNFDTFIEVVKKYAVVYKQFEEIQKDKAFDFVPETGDQKTGLIGEAFIFEYLKRQGYPGLEFGNPSQKVWDIKYPFGLAPNGVVMVQVKTVSAFAKTKAISPIHLSPEYCELYLVSLDKQFIPDNIWKPKGYAGIKIKVYNGEEVVTRIRMPKDDKDFGSGFTGLENVFEDFKKMFPELYPKKPKVVTNFKITVKPKATAKSKTIAEPNASIVKPKVNKVLGQVQIKTTKKKKGK
jgi:hypothetical protein